MRRPAFVGLLVGALFLAASMTPSLVPRAWWFQGLVTGVATAVGYGLGTLASHLWRQLPPREPPAWAKPIAWAVLMTVGPVGVLWITFLGGGWQRAHHELMGMAVPARWWYLGGLLLGLFVAWALVAVARAIRIAARYTGARLARLLPHRIAGVLGGVLVGGLIIGLLDGIVIDRLFAAADDIFRLRDELVAEDTEPPSSALRSGSAASPLAWDALGAQGRAFVGGGPTPREISDLTGRPAQVPIRVYVGLTAAGSDAERAELVLDELDRTGAFDRSVLAVVTTTGTGWIDPDAAAALEYLWSGDTALAAYQYSYLPSSISFLVDSVRAREAGPELFNAVHERWAALPEEDRPLLLVFGESLGADGSEAAFSGIADIRNRTDGVLWVGPPSFSELWAAFTERRDEGSPQRLPIYDGGGTVRFASQPGDLDLPDAPWYEPRVVYLQHASDPVVWWSPRLILRRPVWLAEPPGPDVLPAMRWYPFVTFWQVTADLVSGESVPPGFGHDYGSLVADAWAAIAAPDGWTPADTERLRARLLADARDEVETN